MGACPFDDRLQDFLEERLDDSSRESVERHLPGCADCQESLEKLTGDPALPRWRALRGRNESLDPNLDPTFRLHVESRLTDELRSTPSWVEQPTLGHSRPAVPRSMLRAARRAELPRPTIPGYEILGELGRGGMGVVYQARQLDLNRPVALKMILAGDLASPRELALFRAEAEVVAKLEHPNIVRIHAIGEQDGRPYLSLEYLPGGNLAQRLASGPQAVQPVAELVETLARTIAFAHRHAVVHRDLKPANVLLATDGTPKITDFGLAKRLEGGHSSTTASAVVGTPAYMAPEQVLGRGATTGPAADVYALGAILYEMLAGVPPFRGASPFETLLQVTHADPLPPRQLRPAVPRDLDTICLKCLAKDPRARYASAEALAEDLARYQAGEPILARPLGPAGRAIKWARRRPAVAGLLVAVLLLTVSGFGLVTWLWGQAAATAANERQLRLDLERVSAGVWLDRGAALCERGDVAEGLLAYAHALELADRADASDLERVARDNLAAWPARLIRQRAFFGHNCWAYTIAFSPDGNTILTAGDDGKVKVWDTGTGQERMPPLEHGAPVHTVAFSPDGRIALIASGPFAAGRGEACLWDLETRTVRRFPHPARVFLAAFDRDGTVFLTATPAAAQVWDAKTGEPRGAPMRHQGELGSALFSPDGKRVLTGGADNAARLWDAHTGQPIGRPLLHASPVRALAFRPDGAAVVTGSRDGTVRVWDLANERQLGADLMLRGTARAAAFHPDGQSLAVGGPVDEPRPGGKYAPGRDNNGEVKVWDLKSARLLSTLAHPSLVVSVSFSEDGRFLMTGATDGRARLYDASAGDLIGKPLVHEGTVMSVAFAPGGRPLALTASAGGDHYAAARLWELPPPPTGRPLAPGQAIMSLLFHPTEPALLLAGNRNPAVLRQPLAGGPVERIIVAHKAGVSGMALSGDGRWLLTAGKDRRVCLWDYAKRALIWSADAGNIVEAAGFGPSGATAWTGSRDGQIRAWTTSTGEPIGAPRKVSGRLVALQPLADETVAWIESDDRTVRLCRSDRDAGQVCVWQQPGRVSSAAIRSDVARVLTAGWNEAAHLRDGATGAIVGPALKHAGDRVRGLAFSPDGRTLLTGGWDKAARLWDAATGKPLGPPRLQRELIFTVAFGPDGRAIATGGDVDTAHLWDLPASEPGVPTTVRRGLEDMIGLEIDPRGGVRERVEAIEPAPQALRP